MTTAMHGETRGASDFQLQQGMDPSHLHSVHPGTWMHLCYQRWNLIVPCVLTVCGLALVALIGSLTWHRHRRARIRRAVPFYWENCGRDIKYGNDRSHKHYFDDSFPLSIEQCQALQELMNATCEDSGKAFRLLSARRIESSALWLRYRRRLRDLRRARGPCDFLGGCAQRIREAVEELELPELMPFARRDLATDACETFLWMGTKPENALKIISCGEMLDECAQALDGREDAEYKKTQPRACWRFAEDISVAAEHAKAGSHLYSESYAMLLCRVVLGRQKATCKMSDASRGTSESGSNVNDSAGSSSEWSDDGGAGGALADSMEAFDSIVRPVAGGQAQFVVADSAQVYPEYALVYEPTAPHLLDTPVCAEPSQWTLQRPAARSSVYPLYWQSANRSDGPREFHNMFPLITSKQVLQGLAGKTWKDKWTRDRRGHDGQPIPKGDPFGDMPLGIRIVKAWRLESSALWSRYREHLAWLQMSRDSCTAITFKTTENLKWTIRRQLRSDVNEAYLWHGSSPRAVLGIATEGFNIDLSGTNRGSMFGKGAYFAECSSKADEYSGDDCEGYFKGCFAMLLCRVALGNPQTLLRADHSAHERVGRRQPFDSTVGDRESAVGTYREFVVSSHDAIYPEYAIIYQRVGKNPWAGRSGTELNPCTRRRARSAQKAASDP